MASQEIETLIKMISKLPALGPRSSRRLVLSLLNNKERVFVPLLSAMKKVLDEVQVCPNCGNMDTMVPCSICQNHERTDTQICIVQDVTDLWALERANVFKGHYHVLGGVLSALDGIGPEELKIDSLVAKIKKDRVEEVILALPSTMEGQTTIFYLMDILSELNVKISALSKGVPLGSELDYLDEGTIQMAFTTRK